MTKRTNPIKIESIPQYSSNIQLSRRTPLYTDILQLRRQRDNKSYTSIRSSVVFCNGDDATRFRRGARNAMRIFGRRISDEGTGGFALLWSNTRKYSGAVNFSSMLMLQPRVYIGMYARVVRGCRDTPSAWEIRFNIYSAAEKSDIIADLRRVGVYIFFVHTIQGAQAK